MENDDLVAIISVVNIAWILEVGGFILGQLGTFVRTSHGSLHMRSKMAVISCTWIMFQLPLWKAKGKILLKSTFGKILTLLMMRQKLYLIKDGFKLVFESNKIILTKGYVCGRRLSKGCHAQIECTCTNAIE